MCIRDRALLRSDLFPDAQRERFLRLAQSGVVFLRSHCLMGSDDWRCVFLMDRTGAPKQVGDWPDLDMSIYADCFVIAGLACYSRAAEDAEAYVFARKLYQSAKNRFETGCFKTLPYPCLLYTSTAARKNAGCLAGCTRCFLRALRALRPPL